MTESFPYPKLAKQLTVSELEDIREEVLALAEALKHVPEEFDFSFQEKIHRVLDITNELTSYTKQLRDTIEQSQTSFQEELIHTLAQEQHKRLDQHHTKVENLIYDRIVTDKTFILLSMIGIALLVGGALGSFFYMLAFVF
ncbi:hypothetical protein L1D34_11075 [Vibrio mediterranei]|uniref:hypothetical protein n=1 Tax=Vibrio mediterranei TaxID=689 RepID=UPI001EFDF192|nr:hypothetical protein [Vibrio mediterranei]MCG9625386.1 hypothetical protein [Vibrio mediterranei]